MSKQLGPEDANAVDLLLNTAHGHDGKALTVSFVHHGPGAANGRLASVEKILNLLSELPDVEPSSDLIARTLDRIEEVNYGGAAGGEFRPRTAQTFSSGEQAHA